jgi:malic enzyme
MTTHDFTALPDLASGALGGNVQIVAAAASARVLPDSVSPSELNSTYIVPSVFDPVVAPAVAAAVREAAGKGGESDV